MMDRRKRKKESESDSAPGTTGECESNTEPSEDGERKPECPDGYADEQPKEKKSKDEPAQKD